MSKFTKSLSVFMAGMGLMSTKSQALYQAPESPFWGASDPISLHSLNEGSENLYAAHRSHSSHSSHRSSSGSYSAPSRSQPVDPGRQFTVTPSVADINPADVKLMELIKRVQMGLYIKGYAPGAVDGIMGEKTRIALRQFQKDHGLTPDGLMGTETLNALGVVVPR